jgi:hypothetical protein
MNKEEPKRRLDEVTAAKGASLRLRGIPETPACLSTPELERLCLQGAPEEGQEIEKNKKHVASCVRCQHLLAIVKSVLEKEKQEG